MQHSIGSLSILLWFKYYFNWYSL